MARTKLTSIRLDTRNIERADETAKRMRYWTRSKVIDCILSCVFSCSDERTIERMVRWSDYTNKGEKVNFIQES